MVIDIRKRTAATDIVIHPRAASGSATDSCIVFGCGKAHGPSWMADMAHLTTTIVDLVQHFPRGARGYSIEESPLSGGEGKSVHKI